MLSDRGDRLVRFVDHEPVLALRELDTAAVAHVSPQVAVVRPPAGDEVLAAVAVPVEQDRGPQVGWQVLFHGRVEVETVAVAQRAHARVGRRAGMAGEELDHEPRVRAIRQRPAERALGARDAVEARRAEEFGDARLLGIERHGLVAARVHLEDLHRVGVDLAAERALDHREVQRDGCRVELVGCLAWINFERDAPHRVAKPGRRDRRRRLEAVLPRIEPSQQTPAAVRTLAPRPCIAGLRSSLQARAIALSKRGAYGSGLAAIKRPKP